MSAVAPAAIAAKSQRCHPDAPARKLNAAPGLKLSTSVKNDVSTLNSPGRKASRIASFVS
jgi:hypothetical protein